MFEDLFDTQQDKAVGGNTGHVQSSWDRLPRSCADGLPLPELARKPGYPIGLKNQGATCYLNSLLQILFHTPQLRKTILDLPLCKDNPSQKTDFLNASKHNFMLGFQRLFSEMSLKDTYGLSTDYLKQAFKWQGSQHVVQHDIQQAMKVIFDTFERALVGTQFEKNIRELFKGISSRYKSCRNCTITEERPQDFYGLNLQVQNQNSLQQSILNLLTAQAMQGENKIFCDTCQSKQDMWLGTKLKSLPNVLVLTLTRFTFDYEKLDRVKLTNFFSFNLQYNFSHLLDQAAANDAQYELYGVLIHRGSAHSGHYLCYIRDLMQQSDWKKGLQETQKQQQQNKQKQQKQKQNIMTQQQKAKKQEKNKEEKQFELVQPQNKNLLESWFELDDSRVTAIDAKKITTKYEGSQSAYILFYRKKGIPLPTDLKVPEYFSNIINTQNEALKKQREQYNIKKNQIILKIDGNDQTLSTETKINDIIQIFCPAGYALVNEAKHNGLPYYPKQLNSLKQYVDTETVKSMDLIHQSVWKTYQIDSDEYRQIQPLIQVSRMPFEINVFFNEQNEKLILYQDQTLNDLKLKLQNKYKIPYESQIIKLVTAYREYFVTDDLSNDDVLLTKLGFMHECQIILKKLQAGEKQEQVKKVQQKVELNTICFVIERDDVHGIKRMYFDKNKTLKELFDFVVESEDLDKEVTRRLRNLNGDRLFYNDQYEKTLEELQINEQIVKLRIQRGDVPVKGDICVVAKMQSKFQSQSCPPEIECIFDPNATILEVKTKICEIANLNPQMHRIYQTDWMGEPSRSVTKEKQSIFDAKFGKQEKICIRDIESPIGSELILFDVFETKIGTPEDIKQQPIANIKIEEHKTLKDLKQALLKTQLCKDREGIKINQLRVREIKKDYMFGNILRDNNKQLKNYTFNNNKLAIQILPQEEQLNENQIVLVLKKRNKEKRLYEGHEELIFEAGKSPSIQDLDKAVHTKLGLKQDEKIKIVKYIHYDFEWVEVSEKEIDRFLKNKKSKPEGGGKKKGKQVKGGQQSKKENKQKKQEQNKGQKESDEVVQNKTEQPSEIVEPTIQQSQSQTQPQQAKKQKEVVNNENKQKAQNKKGGNKKQKQQQNQNKPKQQAKRQDCLNLRKAPFLLKDGDWIGYARIEQAQGDDLQTDEDLTLKLLKKNEKAIAKQSRGPQKAFKVNIDF